MALRAAGVSSSVAHTCSKESVRHIAMIKLGQTHIAAKPAARLLQPFQVRMAVDNPPAKQSIQHSSTQNTFSGLRPCLHPRSVAAGAFIETVAATL